MLGWKMVALADNISLAWECWDTRTQGEGEIDSSLLLLIIADYSPAENVKFGDLILKYMKPKSRGIVHPSTSALLS